MNDKIKSALKLIFSLGLGVLLIWYFYNQISAKKEATVDSKKYADFSSVQQVRIAPNTYCKVGDTLLLYNDGQALLCETEAFYFLNTAATRNDKMNFVVGEYRIDIVRIMKKVFADASWFWIILSLLASFSSHIIRSLRWRMMLQPLGYNPKVYNTFFAVMIMYMANMALPRLGEVLRCTMITRYEKIPIEKSLGTMLTERLVDVICVLTLGLIVLVSQYSVIASYFQSEVMSKSTASNLLSIKNIVIASVSMALAVVMINVLIKAFKTSQSKFVLKVKSVLSGLISGIISVKNVQNKPLFLIYTVAIWVCYTLTIYFCLKAVPETSIHGMGVAATCLFFGSLAIVAVQGGLGIYPIVVSKILLLYGTQESIGYAYGWLSWVVQTVLVLVVGFICMILITQLNKEPQSET